MKAKKIYSEEIIEIMRGTPKFIIRWGITVFLIFCLTFLIASCFISYPETLKSEVILIEEKNDTSVLYYYAQCFVPEIFMGKMKSDLNVTIKMDAYSFYEYGCIKGKIDTVIFDNEINRFIAVIKLPNGLNTNFHKTLPFHQQMKGTAEIIIRKRRIISFMFPRLEYLLKKQ